MGFPSLEAPNELVLNDLTEQNKIDIVDAFVADKNIVHLKHSLKLHPDQIRTLHDKLMEIYYAAISDMNLNPSQTQTQLRDTMYALYPEHEESVVDHILTAIVNASTNAGTYTAFKAKFPLEVS